VEGTVSDWPTWATERVIIVPWDPAWSSRAHELAADLGPRLGRWLDGRIEHVGSTAVPGLSAKPVIDLIAPVGSLDASAEADQALMEAGWHLVPPDLDLRPWRRMYVLPEGDRRIAHLHLVERTHPRWRDTLLFRDVLRRRPDLAEAYSRLKVRAAGAHGHDREAYTQAKATFVDGVLREV
jgi:GrpB-like predicted nucleotidyltransferase (UPF0157 family)